MCLLPVQPAYFKCSRCSARGSAVSSIDEQHFLLSDFLFHSYIDTHLLGDLYCANTEETRRQAQP